MAQSFQLSQKMAMSQVLAPQLQQSLALLQAPTLELKALIEQELEQNPVLEEVQSIEIDKAEKNGDSDGSAEETADPTEPPEELEYDPATEKQSNEPVDDFQAEFDRLSQLDQEWRDHFAQSNIPMRTSPEEEEKRQFMFDSLVAGTSLQENLLEQVRMSEIAPEDFQIAEMLIGNIDDHGYLKSSVDELAFSTNTPPEKIAGILSIIQSFHPPGVAARDLRECLMIQLQRSGQEKSLEYRIVRDQMEQLGKRRLPEMARALGQPIEQIQEAMVRIAHLEPRPGRAFLPDNQQYIVPEVFVQKVGDQFTVTLDNENIPHLRISNTYKDLMAGNATPEVRDYIRDKIRAGKFLIKSLHQRQQTILNIAREIVSRQTEFMEKGVANLKPLTMVQVAEVVGVHETTVSRAVSGKYMQTPQGLFEMKYFFTSGIQTTSGVGLSNASVKDKIADMFRK